MKKKLLLITVYFLITSTESDAQWEYTFGPTGSAYVRVTCFAQIGDNYFCGTQGDGIWRSTDNSSSAWTKVSDILVGKRVDALLSSGAGLYAGTDSGVFRSTDNGTNWTKLNVGASFIQSFAVVGTNIFAGGGGVHLSSDGGVTWHPRNNGLVSPSVSSLTVIGTNLFAGTIGGGVFFSSDSGNTWTAVNGGLTINNITALASAGTNLFAAAAQFPNSQVFVSTNYGTNWSLADNGLPSSTEVYFAVSGPNVFAGAYSNGVYMTTDNGANWIEVNEGFGTSRTIRSLGVLGTDLFAGFYNYDIRRRPLSQMITEVESKSNSQPDQFELEQNYPNPFNPSTTIKYKISENSSVILKVYDVLGTEIKTLVNQKQPAGNYEVTFNANELTSGVYLYRLHTELFSLTKKMLYLK